MFDLIGHENEIKNIFDKYKSNNLHSSIIFHGPKGIGKMSFIYKFIDKILNEKFDNKNYLHHLNLFKNNTHPNIKIIKKILDHKLKKIKSSITIDQFRNLKNFFNESSNIKELSKFIIVDSADDLNRNSANSFLKTLEEPKNNTYIFLVSHELSNLIPTIRSRCLKIKLGKHTFENFKKILETNIQNITDEEIKFYYDITYGSPGDAITLHEDNILEIIDFTINSLYSNSINNNHLDLIKNIINLDNEKFKSYLSIIKTILIILNKLKNNQFDSNKYLSDKFIVLKELSKSLSKKNIIDRFDFLTNNEHDLFTYNLDKKLFMLKFLTT